MNDYAYVISVVGVTAPEEAMTFQGTFSEAQKDGLIRLIQVISKALKEEYGDDKVNVRITKTMEVEL